MWKVTGGTAWDLIDLDFHSSHFFCAVAEFRVSHVGVRILNRLKKWSEREREAVSVTKYIINSRGKLPTKVQ